MAEAIDPLTAPAEPVTAQPLASLEELMARLPPEPSWGFYTTPAEARLLRAPNTRWREIASLPELQELRVFSTERDLHWQAGRGVELSVVSGADDGAALAVGGAKWLQRERRSRLWGEHLAGDLWYEERIPDPLRYEGLAPARYAFLRYREYVRDGAVVYVRYLGVEGGE
ncbi:MAG TPA: hypothetical protein VFR03_17455 [Thermoanaerobaculia bacterium]|nr:hypothetical protein [Thermoanaerobaculia bacterium]